MTPQSVPSSSSSAGGRQRTATGSAARSRPAAAPTMVIDPPEWGLRAGMAGGALALVYFLYRLGSTGSLVGGGLGMTPYAVALAVAAGYLLATGRDRIEATSDSVTHYRGSRIKGRSAMRDIQELKVGILTNNLVFRDQRVIRIPTFWSNSERLKVFFTNHLKGRAGKKWDDPLLAGKAALTGKASLGDPRRAAHPAAGPGARTGRPAGGR